MKFKAPIFKKLDPLSITNLWEPSQTHGMKDNKHTAVCRKQKKSTEKLIRFFSNSLATSLSELEEEQRRLDELRRKEEEEMLAQMEEAEREEYQRRKMEEEEQRRIQEEMDR